MSWLAAHCPRLWRAAQQRRAEILEERRVRGAARDKLHHLRWLVAHRELQLVRAQARGNGKYITERTVKLKRARQSLASLEQTLGQDQPQQQEDAA